MTNKQIKDFDLAVKPASTDEYLIQDATGTTKKITRELMHRLNVGFFDYNDLATTTVPVAHDGSQGFIKLPNDTLGPFTNVAYAPEGMTTLWDAIADQFDWSELSIGDMVDLRFDIDITTTAPNQEVVVQMSLAIGGSPYTILLAREQFKAAGTYKMTNYMGGYIGDANTQTKPGEIQLDTDAPATIVVNGWYLKVTKR